MFNAFVLVLGILTIMKFLFLCVLQRIPEMNDEAITQGIIGSVCLWGSFEMYIKFLLGNNKPVVNEVSTSFILTVRGAHFQNIFIRLRRPKHILNNFL